MRLTWPDLLDPSPAPRNSCNCLLTRREEKIAPLIHLPFWGHCVNSRVARTDICLPRTPQERLAYSSSDFFCLPSNKALPMEQYIFCARVKLHANPPL